MAEQHAPELPELIRLDPDHPGFRDATYRARRAEIATLALAHRAGDDLPRVAYTAAEHALWRAVLEQLRELHERRAARAVLEAARELALPCERIPQLAEVNARLAPRTGFRMEPVAGLVAARDFLAALARGTFLSTQYVRHPSRPFYTPEPDVIHELVGHAATLGSPAFARIDRAFGRAAGRVRGEAALERLDRLYWFTREFGLVEEHGEPRAVGAGLLSSCDELEGFAARARLRPFRAEEVFETEYDPTRYQETLFVLPGGERLEPALLDALRRFS
jgi:phenylalanine-4-hydroxylase